MLDSIEAQIIQTSLAREGSIRVRLIGLRSEGHSQLGINFRLTSHAAKQIPNDVWLDCHQNVGRAYLSAPQGRMVILGEPGAGKTVLAIDLVLFLLELRHEDPSMTVPVRLSLGRFERGQNLEDWIVDEVSEQFSLEHRLARVLVDRRRVLPVLDGLDEMDPDGTSFSRASDVVDQVNSYRYGSGLSPIVVCCRTANYNRISAGCAIEDCMEIELVAVSSSERLSFLNAPPDRGTNGYNAIRLGIDVQEDSVFLAGLDTPWKLSLARAALRAGVSVDQISRVLEESRLITTNYYRPDPLIKFVVTAAIDATPQLGKTTSEKLRSLRAVASLMENESDNGRSAVDFAVRDLWKIAGERLVRSVHAGLVAMSFSTLFVLSWSFTVAMIYGFASGLMAREVHRTIAVPLGLGLFEAIAVVTLFITVYRTDFPPAFFRFSVVRPASGQILTAALRSFPSAFAHGFIGGSLFGLLVAYAAVAVNRGTETEGLSASELWFTVAILVIGLGMTFGIVNGTTSIPTAAVQRIRTIGTDSASASTNFFRATAKTGTIIVGATTALGTLILASWHVWTGFQHIGNLSITSTWDAALLGAKLGLYIGFITVLIDPDAGGQYLVRHLVGMLFARVWLGFPLNTWKFVEWGVEAGIFRQAGTNYQFRHKQIQEWLLRTGDTSRALETSRAGGRD